MPQWATHVLWGWEATNKMQRAQQLIHLINEPE
jgi:hypothetical protein